MLLDGSANGGLFIQGSNLPIGRNATVQPRAGIDSVLRVAGASPQLVQTGTFTINLGQSATLFMMLPAGNANFANLLAPSTTLVLDLSSGQASGTVDLRFLAVAGSPPGHVNLNSALGDLSGQAAAHDAIVLPIPGADYRFNACVIGSVDCTVLPVLTLPEGNSLLAFDLGPRRRRRLDRDVQLPGVATREY